MSHLNLFFFIDAMGARVVQDQPVIRDLAPHFRALRSVFGYSSACVPSILSGRLPQDHLHWSFFTHGNDEHMRVPWWLHILPPYIRDRGRVRHRLSTAVRRLNGFKGYFEMYMMPVEHMHRYGYCEKKDLFKPGGLNRGDSIIDVLAQRGTRAWVSDWQRSEDANWAAMTTAVADPGCTFAFIYAASMDAWLHDHTREHRGLGARLGLVRQQIDTVLASARAAHDAVTFHIFSDHGMCTIRQHLDVFPILARTRLRMHLDYHAVIDSTMVRLWFPDERTRTQVHEVLHTVPGLTLLSAQALAAEGCAFPDRRFGDSIWLADPHLLLVPSHMGRTPLAGMHGYSCVHPDSDASYLTNDPYADPHCITDLYALMAAAA